MLVKALLLYLCSFFSIFCGVGIVVDVIMYQRHYTRKEIIYKMVNGTALLSLAAVCLIAIITEFGIV